MTSNTPTFQHPKSPNHISIIMDGNGRWANARRLPRAAGHKKGVDVVKSIVRHAGEIHLPYLTLYAFSSENWSRPEGEIKELMRLLRFYLKAEAADLHKNNVRLRMIGARDRLSDDILDLIQNVEEMTADNTGLNLTVALDYGGRQEIVRAMGSLIASSQASASARAEESQKTETRSLDFARDDALGELEAEFQKHLYTADLPDVDLMIRTSGEQRISNFLLWQSAYAEFYFTETHWPDFTADEFDAAIAEFQNRDRRYGGLESVKNT